MGQIAPLKPVASYSDQLDYIRDMTAGLAKMADQIDEKELAMMLRCALDCRKRGPSPASVETSMAVS